MSARYTAGAASYNWRNAATMAESEASEEEDAPAVQDSGLSKRLYALAKEVSELETDKFRVETRKQREINTLKDQVKGVSGCA
jgi:hypothetical protein